MYADGKTLQSYVIVPIERFYPTYNKRRER